jgi:cell fate (sporulation/competence/biofilm development) regulator YlbF (YheA/YmcA/DUF963 family)
VEENKAKSNDFTNYHGSIGDEMNSVLQCTKSLSEAIVQSEEYKAYNEARDAIKGNIELEIKLNEYRIRSFNLQNSVDNEEYLDELDMLELEFAELKKDPRVSAFLSAELRVCRMVQEVNTAIAKLIDLELKF